MKSKVGPCRAVIDVSIYRYLLRLKILKGREDRKEGGGRGIEIVFTFMARDYEEMDSFILGSG